MKILVGVKHVPDTETKIKLSPDSRHVNEDGVKYDMSPYDEYAVEQALLIREAAGGEVVLVSAGRETAQSTLRKGLAMGADRAVLIADDRLDRTDGLTRARALAAVARREHSELILLGKYGVGTDEAQTGPMLGELLGWPHASAISKLELADGEFTIHREVEGGVEVMQGRLPAVLSCDKGLNTPRYASLKGIMQAKKKPIEKQSPADLDLAEADLDSPKLVWETLEMPPVKQAGVMIDGTARDAAVELARRLREEAKVI